MTRKSRCERPDTSLCGPPSRRPCSRRSTPRRRLFPPPQAVTIDPATKQSVTKRLHNKGRQARQVLTVNGRVKLLRRWWQAEQAGSLAPADEVIDPQLATVSVGVREMAARLNNDSTSFQRTAANLDRTAMIKMSAEQLRRLVLAAGQAVLAAQQQNALPTAFRAADCVVDPQAEQPTTRIYHGLDGVMVPLVTEEEKVKRRAAAVEKRRSSGKTSVPLPPRKRGAGQSFKEFKTIVFYDEHGAHWHEVLSRRSRTQVGAVVRREAQRLGFAYADEKIANVDGADWIRERLTEGPRPLPLDGLGLDFYHLSENVHRCRRRVFGEEHESGRQWAEQLLHAFKHEGYAPAWEQLTVWRTSLTSPRHKAAADKLLNYVSRREEMIQYPQFQGQGWQIGSGPTESRCKTTTHRLKGRGRRWDAPNAEAIAALTTLEDSRQWNFYWPTSSPTGD